MKLFQQRAKATYGHRAIGIGITIATSGQRDTGNANAPVISTTPIRGSSAKAAGSINKAAGTATVLREIVTMMAFPMLAIVIATVMVCPIA